MTQTRSNAQGCCATSPPPCNAPAAPANSVSIPKPANCGGTPTRSSPKPQPRLAGHLSARSQAHTVRLALIYTPLDDATQINAQHLNAGLALWDYTARSAAWALGQLTSDPPAEQIHIALSRSPDGLTHTQLRDLCHRNQPVERLEQTLANLAATSRASHHKTLTAGRPAELWTATPTA